MKNNKKFQMLIAISLFIISLSINSSFAEENPAQEILKNSNPEIIPNHFIIKFKKTLSLVNIENFLQKSRLPIIDKLEINKSFYILTKMVNEKAALEKRLDIIDWIEELRSIALTEVKNQKENPVNDPRYSEQWGLEKIEIAKAWEYAKGKGYNNIPVTIAVIDTGIDYNHEDLKDNLWNNEKEIPNNKKDDDKNGFTDDSMGWNFNRFEQGSLPMDTWGHGTSVAGVAAAIAGNNIGISGVNPFAKIMPLKVFYNQPTKSPIFNLFYAGQAIKYAVDNGADIINASWTLGPWKSKYIYDAISYAEANGIIFITCAGNDTKNTGLQPIYPSCYPLSNIIVVASTNLNDYRSPFSNFAYNIISISAPGEKILTTVPNNKYAEENGTSLAAPFVAGTASLIMQKIKSETPKIEKSEKIKIIKKRLLASADYLGNDYYLYDLYYHFAGMLGGGRLNAYKALAQEPQPNIIYTKVTIDNYKKQNKDELEPGYDFDLVVTLKNFGEEAKDITLEIIPQDAPNGEKSYIIMKNLSPITIKKLAFEETIEVRSTMHLGEEYPYFQYYFDKEKRNLDNLIKFNLDINALNSANSLKYNHNIDLYVYAGKPITPIQEQINKAVPGQTIKVPSGYYIAPREIPQADSYLLTSKLLDFKNKNLNLQTIEGPFKTILNCRGFSQALGILSPLGKSSLHGFNIVKGGVTIEKSTVSLNENILQQVSCINNSHCSLENNIVFESVWGALNTGVDATNNTILGGLSLDGKDGQYLIANNLISIFAKSLLNSNVTLLGNYFITDEENLVPSGNFVTKDPGFVDQANSNFHLKPYSVLIDAGYNEFSPAFDIEGNKRPCGKNVDVGAYEFSGNL